MEHFSIKREFKTEVAAAMPQAEYEAWYIQYIAHMRLLEIPGQEAVCVPTNVSYPYEVPLDRSQMRTVVTGTASDLSVGTSSSYQGGAGTSARGYKPYSKKNMEDPVQRRQLRLIKNREAAKECRRKKKEYIRCLETRVAVLENQNKDLVEELRAIKEMYRHQ